MLEKHVMCRVSLRISGDILKEPQIIVLQQNTDIFPQFSTPVMDLKPNIWKLSAFFFCS